MLMIRASAVVNNQEKLFGNPKISIEIPEVILVWELGYNFIFILHYIFGLLKYILAEKFYEPKCHIV